MSGKNLVALMVSLLMGCIINLPGAVLPDSLHEMKIKEVRERIEGVRQRYPIHAPELPGNLGWLNVKRPLTKEDLSGKIVLLDFWTYGCINCLHVIPDLKFLEEKYAGQPFAVIGVHSAKFNNEQDITHIREAVLRYGIQHPVIVDENYGLWQAFGVNAWPTFVLIDPEGYIVAGFTGEGNRNLIDTYVEALLEKYKDSGILNFDPLPLDRENTRRSYSFLNFPGKVLVDSMRERLYISDSGNNRIVIADLNGTVLDIVGDGRAGFRDGNFREARFSFPQGLALYRTVLLVADTENHAIRVVNLQNREVITIAGTGEKGYSLVGFKDARETHLNSPYDLTVRGEKLFIVMAGTHQIWVLNMDTGRIGKFVGTGKEARVDGALPEAAFAQPSGISSDDSNLYIADSENSAIRKIRLSGEVRVTTLAGGDLFDFGDQDGEAARVRFQHPLGVLNYKGKLYVADTYNHKIKLCDPLTGFTKTLAGDGQAGKRDGKSAQFFEPSGLSAYKNKLYISDTNNHRIRVFNIDDGLTSTLELRNFDQILAKQPIGSLTMSFPGSRSISHPVQKLKPGRSRLSIRLELPQGQKFNPNSPLQYLLTVDPSLIEAPQAGAIQTLSSPTSLIQIPFTVANKPANPDIKIEILYYYCDRDGSGTCKIAAVSHRIPLQISQEGRNSIEIVERPEAERIPHN